jgi:hypothetical protein
VYKEEWGGGKNGVSPCVKKRKVVKRAKRKKEKPSDHFLFYFFPAPVLQKP